MIMSFIVYKDQRLRDTLKKKHIRYLNFSGI